jgi:hypothetical protein
MIQTTKTHKWKIAIFREAVGAGIAQSDVSLPQAWRRLLAKAGPAYITGVNDRGERFGPDLTQEFEQAFKAASNIIKTKTANRYTEYTIDSVRVEIRRLQLD